MTNHLRSDTFLRTLVAGECPKIDIVAIHGLNPKNKERHAERTWEVDGNIWLRDFLPTQLPQARILLFGYNSSVSIQSSSAGVREQAQNLLSRLWLERQGCETRPIIFIAHSLGGILVKEALVQAKLGHTYGSIQTATYGIAFFGTPHRGSHLARIGETLAKAVRAFLRTPNNTFINALKENDLYANELSANFEQLLEDYKYINFYETLPLRSLGIIVEKKSATFGLPDSRELTVALVGDHESICRYPSEADERYIHVSGLIARFAAIAMKECEEASLFGDSSAVSVLTGTTLAVDEPTHQICMIPFGRNAGFVDRGSVLDQIKGLSLLKGTTRVAVFGLGGVGKSHIAIEYSHRVSAGSETSVFWVSASSIDRFVQGYNGIFDKYIASGPDEKCNKLIRVKEWLETKRDEWVLIIDNADETYLFETSKQGKQAEEETSIWQYLPESQHGTILVTTRNRAAGVKFTKGVANALIEVKPMTTEESKCLIKNTMADPELDDLEVEKLSNVLGHLPLAIVQAAAFMQANTMSISEYIELYNDSEETSMDLLCEQFEALGRDTGVPNAVATTLIVSLDQIKKREPNAVEVLQLLAFLDRNEVPKSLIQHRIKKPLELAKALGTLKAFSLVTSTDGKGSISFHRLVQLVLRKWLLLEKKYEEKAIEAMELLDEAYPDATFENWSVCAAYLLHAQAVLSLIPDVKDDLRKKRIHLQEGIAYYYWSQGRNEEAERLDLLLVEEKKKVFGPEHEETIASISGLAASYNDQGRWPEAEKLDTVVVEVRKKLFGLRDRTTLTSMENLAATVESQGRMDEAEAMRMEVLEITRSEFGEDDEQTIDSMAELGPLYLFTGRADEAEKLIKHALRWRNKKFGAEHKHSLACASVLGEIYNAQGKLEEAEKLALETHNAKETCLGPNHPETHVELIRLADVYHKQGKLDKAEGLLLQVLDSNSESRVLSFDHLSYKLRLADVYWTQDKQSAAKDLENEVLKGSLELLGPEHPFTIKCFSVIAASYWRQELEDAAIQRMAQVTHMAETSLGAYHDDTLRYLGTLTEWCGEDKDAIEILLEVEEKADGSRAAMEGWTFV